MIVSRETEDLLRAYSDLINKWNNAINLVAPATIPDLWHRHIMDSAQLHDLAGAKHGSWMDMGSGGGLPGVVISILSKQSDLAITLVESDRRKSAFLATVKRELSLANLSIKTERIEDVEQGNHNYVSARALASLTNLMPHLQRQLARDGEAWLLKGRSWKDEVSDAQKHWNFQLQSFPSITDSDAAILKLRKIEPND